MENIFSTAARKAVNFPRDSDPYVPLSNRFVYIRNATKNSACFTTSHLATNQPVYFTIPDNLLFHLDSWTRNRANKGDLVSRRKNPEDIYIHVEVVDEGPAQLRMIYRGEPRWNNATEFKDRAR